MRTRGITISMLIVVALLSQACATIAPAPQRVAAYPSRGQSGEQIILDTKECEVWARQATGYNDPAGEGLKKGLTWGVIWGVAGAAVGAAMGAVVGIPGEGAALGAIIGGSTGGISQGIDGANEMQGRYQRAYAVCMSQRG